jgi:carboxylate-amine ligase
MGVEEELILIDGDARPSNVAAEVVRVASVREERHPASHDPRGGSLGHEVQKAQVETDTPPVSRLDDLEEALRTWRERARASALEAGARILASGTSPLNGESKVLRTQRFDAIGHRYGLMLAEQLVCGCHVHVDVSGPDEGVGVLDRVRPWLPLLLAMSANSPWWQGIDTAYASYRSQVMARWPSAGPAPIFGSARAYRDQVEAMLATGVLLDEAMVYWDARLSAHHPTIEIRTADVCLDVRDTVLVAALARALVETAAREWEEGCPPPEVATQLVRLANWKAGRYGLTGELVDPRTGKPAPADEVLGALQDHVAGALNDAGDTELAAEGCARLLSSGTGAGRQRAAIEAAGGDLAAAVHDARERFLPL